MGGNNLKEELNYPVQSLLKVPYTILSLRHSSDTSGFLSNALWSNSFKQTWVAAPGHLVIALPIDRAFAHLCSTLHLLFWRQMPSWSGKVCSTKALGHCPQGKFLSSKNTKSPTFKFGFGCNHFSHSLSVSTYSLVHLYQHSLWRRWTCFHLAFNGSDSSNTSGDEHRFLRNRTIWLGDNASICCGSSEVGMIGLSFRIFSTSARNVLREEERASIWLWIDLMRRTLQGMDTDFYATERFGSHLYIQMWKLSKK